MSLTKLVPHVLPFLSPFLFLLHQFYPSESDIKSLPKEFPVLFLSGSRDELVPPSHVKELYDKCDSNSKEIQHFELGTHNDTCMQPHYFPIISNFIAKHTKSSTPTPAESVATSETGSFEMVEGEEDSELEGAGSRFDVAGIVKEKVAEKL